MFCERNFFALLSLRMNRRNITNFAFFGAVYLGTILLAQESSTNRITTQNVSANNKRVSSAKVFDAGTRG